MNKKQRKHITKSWEKALCDNNEIAGLFKSLEIEDLKNIRVLSRTYSDDARMIIELTADNIDGTLFRVIIDATSGIPTWGQFINITYDQGKSADLRIILYGKDHRNYKKDFTAGGIIEIANLVRCNNLCGVTTYFVKGTKFFKENGQKNLTERDIQERPINVALDTCENFPSKRQVQEAEFWTGYYFPQWWIGEVGLDDDIINCWKPGYSLDKDLRTVASWNDRGFFIKLVEDKHSDALQWIWDNRKSEFEKAYPESNITFDKIDDERHAISVRILDVSMTDLIDMTPEDKWYYGQSVFDQEHNFEEVADSVIEDYDAMVKAANIA